MQDVAAERAVGGLHLGQKFCAAPGFVERVARSGGIAIEAVERIFELTGGMGTLLFNAHEWTTWEKTLKSYELWARYVMPHFQGQIAPKQANRDWVADHRKTIFAPAQAAIGKAFVDAGIDLPPEMLARMNRGRT